MNGLGDGTERSELGSSFDGWFGIAMADKELIASERRLGVKELFTDRVSRCS